MEHPPHPNQSNKRRREDMTRITGTTYLETASANDNGIPMREIYEAPYFVVCRPGQPYDFVVRV